VAHNFEQDETHICAGWTFGQPKAAQNHLWCFVCLASGVYRGIVVGGDEAKIRQRLKPTKKPLTSYNLMVLKISKELIIEQLHKPQP